MHIDPKVLKIQPFLFKPGYEQTSFVPSTTTLQILVSVLYLQAVSVDYLLRQTEALVYILLFYNSEHKTVSEIG